MLARSVVGLRFAGMRSGDGAESPPYRVCRKDQPPQAQIVEGEEVGWRMKYVLILQTSAISSNKLKVTSRRKRTGPV